MSEIEKNIFESIRSRHIQEIVISFLKEKQKFNLFVYNKKLQKKFNIDIEAYKKKSGKYKKGKKNGEGEEYSLNTDNLIFKGD